MEVPTVVAIFAIACATLIALVIVFRAPPEALEKIFDRFTKWFGK